MANDDSRNFNFLSCNLSIEKKVVTISNIVVTRKNVLIESKGILSNSNYLKIHHKMINTITNNTENTTFNLFNFSLENNEEPL